MRISTDALVIKEKTIKENDRVITLMTRNHGVISAFAHGAKSVKSKKGAGTGLLTYSDFELEEKKGVFTVKEASVKHCFFIMGEDIADLALSQYFCEICSVLGNDEQNSEAFLRTVLNSLYLLTSQKKSRNFIKSVTELRIASLSGYMPDLTACAGCGSFEDEKMYFSLSEGILLCGNCKQQHAQTEFLSPAVLKAMRHIIYSDLKDIYSFSITEENEKTLSEISEKYILFQTEHEFPTLKFYKSLL